MTVRLRMKAGRDSWRKYQRKGQSQQRRLQSIVERMADGVVIVDRAGIIRFANPAAERLFGRTAEELTGRELGFPVVTGDTTEVEVVRPQQQTVTAELRTVDIEWEGKPAHLVSLRDITDRKRAEERAAQLDRERLARIEAEAANRAKSDFLALMSHELRTPLNAVIGYAELLSLGVGGGELGQQQQEHVSRIAASGRHLLGLVNEILDLAKVEAGQLSLQQGVGVSRDIIGSTIELIQPVAEARGVTVSVESTATGQMAFHGDENRVRQILVNLVNNAIKFTNPGGRVTLEYGSTAKPDQNARLFGPGPWQFFRVSDTGIGIPVDKLAEIFDPFVQVEGGHARRQEGSGLGLAISRRLARLMRGDITVTSRPGEGSVFTLWLTDASAGAEKPDGVDGSADQDSRIVGLGDVGGALLHELPGLLEAFVRRLREELGLDVTGRLKPCDLSGHVGAFVADVACSLAAQEEAQGRPSTVLADAAHVQAAISERHGMQRAELGWTPNQVSREWLILSEEMKRIVRLHGRGIPPDTVKEAFAMIDRVVEEAVETSCRALNRVSAEEPTTDLILAQVQPGHAKE